MSRKTKLVVVGPVLPPINGRTVVTIEMLERFKKAGADIAVFDVSKRYGLINPLVKLIKFLLASFYILIVSLKRDVVLYLPVDGDHGLYYDLILAFITSTRCKRCLLHHHSFRYVRDYDWRMQWLVKLYGDDALHITQCNVMGRKLRERYEGHLRYLALSNAFLVNTPNKPKQSVGGRPVVLGHLSNLCREKGLYEAVEVAMLLNNRGINCKLLLGGPFVDSKDQLRMSELERERPGILEILGPLYGIKKSEFFKSIDVFLFPTRYKTETEGIVLLEALASGVPVITYKIGCIPERIDDQVGRLVPLDNAMSKEVGAGTFDWLGDTAELSKKSGISRERFLRLSNESHGALNKILSEVLA